MKKKMKEKGTVEEKSKIKKVSPPLLLFPLTFRFFKIKLGLWGGAAQKKNHPPQDADIKKKVSTKKQFRTYYMEKRSISPLIWALLIARFFLIFFGKYETLRHASIPFPSAEEKKYNLKNIPPLRYLLKTHNILTLKAPSPNSLGCNNTPAAAPPLPKNPIFFPSQKKTEEIKERIRTFL